MRRRSPDVSAKSSAPKPTERGPWTPPTRSNTGSTSLEASNAVKTVESSTKIGDSTSESSS
uniref:Uncharacterized protein n=1 Tax=Hyaloperonospora arabidopsidis (strain Emoy2) TaxID=559515 RepID=M4BLJ6_HYAAE